MPTYSAITDAEIAVNKPITNSLMTRMRDNSLAIFEQLGWSTDAKVYVSPEQTISAGGTFSINHGISGLSPTNAIVGLFLICKSGEHGYSTNDVVPFSPSGQGSSGSTGISTVLSATQVKCRFGSSSLNLTNKSNGAAATITAASWKCVVNVRGG